MIESEWRDLGFLRQPELIQAPPGMVLYRVYGGVSSMTGSTKSKYVFFTDKKPTSGLNAEKSLSVMEYGNSASNVATFAVVPGTRMYVGIVHPGDYAAPGWDQGGTQFVVEAPIEGKVIPISTNRLVSGGSHFVSPRSGSA